MQARLFEPPVLEQLGADAGPLPSSLRRPVPPLAPLPERHTLDVKDPSSLEAPAFGDLSDRCFRVVLLTSHTEKVVEETLEEELGEEFRPWSLQRSVFAPRLKESDAKAFYDSEVSLMQMMSVDWSRVAAKDKFQQFLAREDKTWGRGKVFGEKRAGADVLEEVRRTLAKHYGAIVSAFMYYASVGTGGEFTMQLNEYSLFLEECKIPDNDRKSRAKRSDLDTIFIVCNFNEDKSTEHVNDTNSLVRFEFLEALVRIACAKHGHRCGAKCTSPEEAVEELCTSEVTKRLPIGALVDSNDFRRERLYYQEVDKAFYNHLPLLKAIYSRFRGPKDGRRRAKLLRLEDWMKFVTAARLVGDPLDPDFAMRDARLCYIWSRMVVYDEIGDVARHESLTFVDFLEALGRVAELRALPSYDELERSGYGTSAFDYSQKARENVSLVMQRRPSVELGAPPTRPLHEKVNILLQYIFHELDFSPIYGQSYQLDLDRLMKMVQAKDAELGP